MTPGLAQARGLQLNPRLAPQAKTVLMAAWKDRRDEIEILAPGAIGILTSGSTQSQANEVSIVILSEAAVLASAAAVNQHLALKSQHVWGLMLPTFHVGGYMIPERAALSNSRVAIFNEDWNPSAAVQFLAANAVTHLSWVPTQVFDVVTAGLAAPASLEAVIVGGGRLDPSLKARGRELGWPLLESYGMTEFGSQIATECVAAKSLNTSSFVSAGWMKTLPHVEVESEVEGTLGRLKVRGSSGFSGHLVVDLSTGESRLLQRENREDFWLTQDRVEILRNAEGVWLKFLGRAVDVVKVLGENVDLARVRRAIAEVFSQSSYSGKDVQVAGWEIVALPDARREHEIVLALESGKIQFSGSNFLSQLQLELKNTLAPFELPTRVCEVPNIPRSSLGKVKFPELRELLTEASKI